MAETPKAEAKRLIAASGLNQGELASLLTKVLGRKVENYTISRMTAGKRDVSADEMDALRAIVAERAGPPGVREPAATFRPAYRLTETAQVVPLYAATGTAGLRLGEANMIGVVPVHPAQQGARDPFAVVIPDNRLADRLTRGDNAYCVRGRPPLKDQLCLVERTDGSQLAWFYDREDGQTLFVRQNAPKKVEGIPLREVAAVYLIVGATFG